MRLSLAFVALVFIVVAFAAAQQIRAMGQPPESLSRSFVENRASSIINPAIDMDGYRSVVNEAARHRASRRLTEEQFLEMSRDPATIVLDARSRDMFALLHIEGATNLPFPDIAFVTLEKLIPDKATRILIYCNNNFQNNTTAFPSKAPPASLNLVTYTALYNYGYENVYELGPLLDVHTTILPLVSSE
ncbi:MAG: rhodanese-like domain-containing protein [Phycisphaerales bacterium]